jgi:hypothetical protein
MRSVGLVGHGNTVDRLIQDHKNVLVYHFDTRHPLQLTVYNGEKVRVMDRKDFPYLCPLSELVKAVDGMIYVCASEGMDVTTVLDEIDGAMKFDVKDDEPRPKVFVEYLEEDEKFPFLGDEQWQPELAFA